MKQKVKHHFVKSATAFLDTIGHRYPRFINQHTTAQYWTDNQEKIVQSITKFTDGHARIAASLLRQFGKLSETALYFNELKTSEPCK